MAVKKTYRINLRNYGSPPAVMVSQYDEGYAIAFEIFDGPLPVLASSLSGYTFKLKGRQPGNPTFLAYEFEGTLATALNAVVSFEIDTTMTGRAGKGTAELVILDEENDVKFASVNFAVYTEPAAVPDGSIDADVQRAMEIAEEVQEIVDTAAAEVKGEAEAWAVGQRDGQDVPSTDPTYENNAKYYAEQAQDIADSIGIDATLSVAGKAADAKKTGDEISELKEDLNDVEATIANVPILKDSDAETPDFDVADVDGNVLVRMEGGGIETKRFRGFSFITYKSETKTYTGTFPFTLTVNHHFSKGDRIVLHVERGAKPWSYGAYMSYYADNKNIFGELRGDNAYIEYVVQEDVDEISAVYTSATSGISTGRDFTLEVSLLGDVPIRPTVVTVKQDGTGDFTTLRGALDSIGTKANDVLNPYRIEIYEGTYDVLADYTDEEIASAEYTSTGFVGPKLLNGMSLVGMGTTPHDVVLTASLDPEEWDSSIRGVISTLNCQGSCGFENMTIIGHNLRYCVHDDFTQPYVQRVKRHVKDVILRGYGFGYNPATTYGAGTRFSCGKYVFENVDFGENGGLHTSTNLLAPAFVHLINCKGHGFRIGDNETVTPITDYSVYQFDNCDIPWINHRMDGAEPHVIVRGCGGTSPLYQFDPDLLYDTGDVVIVPNSGKESQYSGAGTVLEWYVNQGHGPRWRVATSYDTAHGIIVYEDNDNTYIQIKGYVRTDRTGITSPNLGDYVGVSNGQAVIVADADAAFGRIGYIDNKGCGYIKLDWRG